MNKIIAYGYSLFLLVPLVFISVAYYSYYSVLNAIGKVLPFKDGIYALAKEKAVSIKIFPVHYGDCILSIQMYGFMLLPVYILLNYLLVKRKKLAWFPVKFVLVLLLEYFITFLLFLCYSPVNWYAGLILD